MPQSTLENVIYYRSAGYSSLLRLPQKGEMHGARRVATFCMLTAVLPTVLLVIPLYLRHSVFSDKIFEVAEDDVLEVADGISTVFCQEHGLKMNFTFNAFQLGNFSELSSEMKDRKITKNFSLPDDTWDYWGTFLPHGSVINVSICSSHKGARVLLVKGDKNLQKCNFVDQVAPKLIDRISADLLTNKKISVYTVNQQGQTFPEIVEHGPDTHSHLPSVEFDEEFEGEDETDDGSDLPLTFSKRNGRLSGFGQMKNTGKTIAFKDMSPGNKVGSNSLDTEEDKALEVIKSHLQKHVNSSFHWNESDISVNSSRRVRHAKSRARNIRQKEDNVSVSSKYMNRNSENTVTVEPLSNSLNKELNNSELNIEAGHKKEEGLYRRNRRDIHTLDSGITQGNNANYTELADDDESSDSSFEDELLTCFRDNIIWIHEIVPSENCMKDNGNVTYTVVQFDVEEKGYYNYIFYSDNDLVENVIGATFELHKPNFRHSNYTPACIKQTECIFDLSFWSNEVVVVEVPDHGFHNDHAMHLISSCYPRMSVYIIFPISVLFLILGCAFL